MAFGHDRVLAAGAHWSLQGTHIGGLIVCFWDGDEEMGHIWTRISKSIAQEKSARRRSDVLSGVVVEVGVILVSLMIEQEQNF